MQNNNWMVFEKDTLHPDKLWTDIIKSNFLWD